jgi:hypothetical protein
MKYIHLILTQTGRVTRGANAGMGKYDIHVDTEEGERLKLNSIECEDSKVVTMTLMLHPLCRECSIIVQSSN